jgi:hypothetical protein
MFISAAQTDVGVFVRWLQLDRALELLNGIFILAGSAGNGSQANMAGGSGIAQSNRFRTRVPGLCDQTLVFARGVFRPVGAAQIGFGSSVIRINFECLFEQNDRAVHIGRFARVLQISAGLSVIVVGVGHGRPVKGKFAGLVRFQFQSERRDDCGRNLIFEGERVGHRGINRAGLEHFSGLRIVARIADPDQGARPLQADVQAGICAKFLARLGQTGYIFLTNLARRHDLQGMVVAQLGQLGSQRVH